MTPKTINVQLVHLRDDKRLLEMDGDVGTLVPIPLLSIHWPASPGSAYLRMPVLLPEDMTLELLEKTFDIGNLKIEDLELIPITITVQFTNVPKV